MNDQFPQPPSFSFGPTGPLPAPEVVPPPPPDYQPPASEEAPPVKASPVRWLIPSLGGLLLVVLIVFVVLKIMGSKSSGPKSASVPKQTISVTYWGLWEPSQVMQPLIDDFEKTNPTIKINYQVQSPQDYQDRVISSLDKNPPDIVRLHTTWMPLVIKNLYPAPANSITPAEVSTNFYPLVSDLTVIGGQVYGVPITTEGLALFINSSMYQQQSLTDPKTWEDLLTNAAALTTYDPATGKISRSGVALGNTSNVEHWPDILSLMLLQSGTNLSAPADPSLTETLNFYTSFVTGLNKASKKIWDDTLPDSILAFANEKVAMIFAPTWRAAEIKILNPNLQWRAVPVPQLPEVDPTNWASIWFEAVPKNAKHPQEAWKFLSYLASAQAQQLLFDTAAKDRSYPQPPANKAVASVAQSNPIIAPYLLELPTAKTFYTASLTRDSNTALNSRLIKYLEDAVNTFLKPNVQDKKNAVETLAKGFNQVLSQYRLVAPLPTPTR